jgi:hypothetical protein
MSNTISNSPRGLVTQAMGMWANVLIYLTIKLKLLNKILFNN